MYDVHHSVSDTRAQLAAHTFVFPDLQLPASTFGLDQKSELHPSNIIVDMCHQSILVQPRYGPLTFGATSTHGRKHSRTKSALSLKRGVVVLEVPRASTGKRVRADCPFEKYEALWGVAGAIIGGINNASCGVRLVGTVVRKDGCYGVKVLSGVALALWAWREPLCKTAPARQHVIPDTLRSSLGSKRNTGLAHTPWTRQH